MFFFTELDKLNAQTLPQAFGPAPGNPYYAYNLTNKFSLKGPAKAFMPLKGAVLVVPQHGDPQAPLVNVIIKVVGQPANQYTPIAFIIYRGILKNSLFTTSGALLPKGTNSLLARVWSNWERDQARPTPQAPAGGPVPDALGWSAPTKVPDNAQLASIFGEATYGFQLPILKAGNVVGTFDAAAEVGIEIILADPVVQPLMSLAYEVENVLTEQQSQQNSLTLTPTAKIIREQILGYLDVSTFYALGNGAGGIGYQENGVIDKCISTKAIYNKLLSYCIGRNRLYLDLRNETSQSLNHYNEYVNDQDPAGTAPFQYGFAGGQALSGYDDADRWPLYYLNLGGNEGAELRLAFPTNRNPDPLVYREFGVLGDALLKKTGAQTQFISLYNHAYTDLVGGLSKEITFKLSVVQNTAGSQVAIGSIIKLMVLRRTAGPLEIEDGGGGKKDLFTNNDGPPRNTYLDGVFGPIRSLSGQAQHTTYAKRWICQGDVITKTIVGYLVQPTREYTATQVIFKASVLATYRVGGIGADILDKNLLTYFGPEVTISYLGPDNKYNLAREGEVWEKSVLGADMRQVEFSTASIPNVSVLNTWGEPEKPFVSFTLSFSRPEYEALAAQATVFDQNLGEIYCFFTAFSVEQATGASSLGTPPLLIGTTLTLGGYSGNRYVVLGDGQMARSIHCYSIDYQNFTTRGFGAASGLPQPATVADYTAAKYTADLRVMEQAYATRDVRIDQEVTRQRVHFYGYNYGRTSVSDMGKGYLFNLYIPWADYWEQRPGALLPCERTLASSVPPSKPRQWFGCRVRQLYDTDAGMSGALIQRLTNGAKQFVDPANHVLDMGHTLYTLDALFQGPEIPKRDAIPSPDIGYRLIGVTNGVDLATFMGDLTIALGEAYYEYYDEGKLDKNFRDKYTLREYLDLKYTVSSSLIDIYGDADGFGLYEVWEKVFNKQLSTKLSDLISTYYSDTSPVDYSYRSRWKIVCLRNGFITYDAGLGRYRWAPDRADLIQRLEAGYQLTYRVKSEPNTAGFAISTDGAATILLGGVHRLDYSDGAYLIDKFLTQVKGLLQREQPTWQLA